MLDPSKVEQLAEMSADISAFGKELTREIQQAEIALASIGVKQVSVQLKQGGRLSWTRDGLVASIPTLPDKQLSQCPLKIRMEAAALLPELIEKMLDHQREVLRSIEEADNG